MNSKIFVLLLKKKSYIFSCSASPCAGLSVSPDSSRGVVIAVVVVVVVMVVISTIVIIVVVSLLLVVRSRKRRSNRALNQISSLQLVTPEESEDVDGSSPEKQDQ